MSWDGLVSGLRAASLSGAVITLAVLLLRTALQDRTPRRVFCLLWDMALVRLLVLAALPSPVSVWQWLPAPASVQRAEIGRAVILGPAAPAAQAVIGDTAILGTAALPGASPDMDAVLFAVWLAAALALAVWFLRAHVRFRRSCAGSLPCTDACVRGWLAACSLRRRIQVRTSDRVAAPLTYGIVRPVILLPAGMDWPDRAALSCILEHEFQHIRRFDTLRKALLAAALCLHWFNPLVWVLYVLSNRDMELSCDEAVTARGVDRAGYARTLLNMEEQRGQWGGSHFSQNALEERIRCIMQYKKTSIAALIAVAAVMSITVAAFASDPPEGKTQPPSGQDAPVNGNVRDNSQAVEGDVQILSKGGEDGEKLYSVDGGKTWLSEEEYHAKFGGDDWQVEWWTAEDYAAWLEEEKQALQSIIGERGYTGGEGWFTWDQKRVDETIALYESILEDIKNGALYSRNITDKNGNPVEDVALGSGTLDAAEIFTFDEKDAVVPKTVDEAALSEELKAFGVGGNANLMTYNGQLIRRLVDGVPAGDNGYSVQYVYTNPDGVVDVHTLRSVIRNPDGSYDPMGELTGVAAEGEPGFDQGLMDCATAFEGVQATAVADMDTGTGLEPYTAFGLRYENRPDQNGEMQLYMSWNGKSVHSLWDTETGTWYANNMHGTELGDGAVDLETVYRDGVLCGLQESQPPHEVLHGVEDVETAAASGGSGVGGRSFEEVFALYQPYGLNYSPRESGMGSLTWNGQAVRSFADLKPDGGAFSYQDPSAEDGLRVYTEYDASGRLTGLRTA